MIRKLILSLSVLSIILIFKSNAQKTPVFLDVSKSTEDRINDLLSKLTLEEKVDMMVNNTPGVPRLNIKPYDWWNEGLHGVGRAGVATVFPQAIALGATFDTSLVYNIASAISDEARAMYVASVRKGNYLRYSGLTFWSPNINIFRDPRWGRGQETYGEDPFLTSQLGVSFVRGMQGNNRDYMKTGACAKHYAVHSGPEELRHKFDAEVTDKDLFETYLPAFKALVDEDVAGVMCAYNSVNGEPCCSNNRLLLELLRNKWGFKGYIVSDCWALTDFHTGHKTTANSIESAADALKGGVNLNCGIVYYQLTEAVKRGMVTEDEIDKSLTVLLRIQYKLGLFDPLEANPYNSISQDVIDSEEHRKLSYKAATESIVLLKNEGVLPLRNDLPMYFVTGPNAAGIDALLGNYNGVSSDMVTVLEGICAHVQNGSQVQYRLGCMLSQENAYPMEWNTGLAGYADVTIAVLGITSALEGEEGAAIVSHYQGDIIDYKLPENQMQYLRDLRKAGKNKPIIAVITAGCPLDLSEVHELADAVIYLWYPGEEGGNALSDILFGKLSPSGRLPVTFPKSLNDIPPYEDYSMVGRTYKYMDKEPQYPFGYGLSYTKFSYSDISLNNDKPGRNEKFDLTVTVKNEGHVESDEVVQLYVTDVKAPVRVPKYDLKGIRRIHLKPGESEKISFTMTPDMFTFINDEGEAQFEPGEFKLYIGGSLPSKRSVDLGVPAWRETVVSIK
jgi:beta-glucosidase